MAIYKIKVNVCNNVRLSGSGTVFDNYICAF